MTFNLLTTESEVVFGTVDGGDVMERPNDQVFRIAHACAQCGALIVAPEWSEYLSERRVRHLWSCEDCEYQFESTVHLSVPEQEPSLNPP